MSNKIFLVSKKAIWSDLVYNNLKQDFDCEYFHDDSYKDFLSEYKPDWVFFFHWSKMVPSTIYKNYRCVVLHAGNLPKNRGGTPLQNQILDGIIETRVNAITMEKEVDSGDVYCSLPLTLQGSIMDIWLSISDRVYRLIKKCVVENPTPQQQKGKPQIYKRNKDNSLPLHKYSDLIRVHKFIQMLDGETYPNAFCEIGNFKLEFSRSKLNGDHIVSDVIIRKIINE
tara:strand:+ start:61 stop:738 length:678 start_codon:yes stop_codon:yes gene_type:complete